MIRIQGDVLRRIEVHGENSYPEECCGMLLGDYREGEYDIRSVHEIPNSQTEQKERRFLITVDQYRQCERIAANTGTSLLGFYHSHPDHRAYPSDFDKEHALPWFVYLIVSVENGKAGELTGWVLNADRSSFGELSVEKSDSNTRPYI